MTNNYSKARPKMFESYLHQKVENSKDFLILASTVYQLDQQFHHYKTVECMQTCDHTL